MRDRQELKLSSTLEIHIDSST